LEKQSLHWRPLLMASSIQSNFSLGEISEDLYARQDFNGYYKSVKKARNVLITPQGGLTRRFGTQFSDSITGTKIFKEVSTFSFKIGILSKYTLVMQPDKMRIFYERNQVAELNQPYEPEEIQDLRYKQIGNDVLIFHENYQTKVLSRTASEALTIENLGSLQNTLKTTACIGNKIGQVLPVKFQSSGTLPSSNPNLNTQSTYFIRITNSDFNEFTVHEDPIEARKKLNPLVINSAGTSSEVVPQNKWEISLFEFKNKPTYDFNRDYYEARFSFNNSNSLSSPNVLSCDEPVFTPEHAGGLFIFPFDVSVDRLVGRIDTYIDATHVKLEGVWESQPKPEVNTFSNIRGSDSFLLEPVFSDKRGWPRNGEVFQNRFVAIGNKVFPGVPWLSVTNNETDFNDSNADDTSAIALFSSKDSGYILRSASSRTLTFFSTNGIYSTSYTSTQALTPKNANLTKANVDGIEDVQPLFVDNQIIYVNKGGKVINSVLFDININSYRFKNVSITADHMINKPLYAIELKNNDMLSANYALFSNSNGALAVYHTLLEQEMVGWTQCDTDGLFRNLSGIDNEVMAIVERTVNGETQLYIEYLDFDLKTDSTISFSYDEPVVEVTGLYHLNGKTVKVIADGYVYTLSVENNTIFLPKPATTIQVGMPVTIEVNPNDFAIPESGTYFYKNKIISSVYLDLYNTLSVKINGEIIPDLRFGYSAISEPPVPKTMVYKTSPMTGPNREMILSITQDDPFPFTLRAIGYEVK
jgi:hypothetical protein